MFFKTGRFIMENCFLKIFKCLHVSNVFEHIYIVYSFIYIYIYIYIYINFCNGFAGFPWVLWTVGYWSLFFWQISPRWGPQKLYYKDQCMINDKCTVYFSNFNIFFGSMKRWLSNRIENRIEAYYSFLW